MLSMDDVTNVIDAHSIKEFKSKVFSYIQSGYKIISADSNGAILENNDNAIVGIANTLGDSDEEEALEDWLERVFEKRMYGALTSAFLGLFFNDKE